MKKQQLLHLACLGLVVIASSGLRAQAQTAKDELDYSASICTPRNAGQFHGSDRQGFAWDSRGFWVNKDEDEKQTLVCPIPFDRRAVKADGSFGTIEVRVNVFDHSHLDEIVARVFGSTGATDPTGPPVPALTIADTHNKEFTGADTLLLRFSPSSNIRYLWLEIDVPRVVWPAKQSAVFGYRVNRVGFD